MSEILIAGRNAIVKLPTGGRRKIRKGITLADAESWIVRSSPHLWQSLTVDFPADDPEPEAEPDGGPEPSAAEVRAWASDAGIEVPDRGRLGDDIVEQYKAAHAGEG